MTTHQVSDAELIAPARHVFLSPHYDDIALSCGGTARKITELGGKPEIALIFGDHSDPTQPLTEFALTLHKQWGMDAAEVIAGRRAEEANASAVLGTSDVFLPFRDAIYRGLNYMSDEQLFGSPAPSETGIPSDIVAAAGLNEADPSSVRVYAPLAVGLHIDHQHAFAAGLSLTARGFDVWFYEDLPYGLRPGARDHRVSAAGVPLEPAILVDVHQQWTPKIDAIFAYPSQLSTIFVDYVGVSAERSAVDAAMSAYARGVGNGTLSERFWKTA